MVKMFSIRIASRLFQYSTSSIAKHVCSEVVDPPIGEQRTYSQVLSSLFFSDSHTLTKTNHIYTLTHNPYKQIIGGANERITSGDRTDRKSELVKERPAAPPPLSLSLSPSLFTGASAVRIDVRVLVREADVLQRDTDLRALSSIVENIQLSLSLCVCVCVCIRICIVWLCVAERVEEHIHTRIQFAFLYILLYTFSPVCASVHARREWRVSKASCDRKTTGNDTHLMLVCINPLNVHAPSPQVCC